MYLNEVQQQTQMTDMEMLHTFNCGYGMVIITQQEIHQEQLHYLGTIIENKQPRLLDL